MHVESPQATFGIDGDVPPKRGFWNTVFNSPVARILIGIGLIALANLLSVLFLDYAEAFIPAIRNYFLASPAIPGLATSMHVSLPKLWVANIVLTLTAIAAYYLFVRWTERRTVTELAGRGALAELALGFGLGGGLIVLSILALWASGYYRFIGMGTLGTILPALAFFLGASVGEELIFRGVIFRIVEQSLGTWLALTISALLFGFAHIANPNASVFAAIAIALEAGVLLGAAYLVTRRLWLVFGAHFAWNVTQGGIFGIPVSGFKVPGLFQTEASGPTLMSGGAFGVETSIVAVSFCLIAAVLLLVVAHRKNRFVQPFWRRTQ